MRWSLKAPRGCMNLLGIFGESFEWISPNLANLVQTCSKCSLKILNWRPVDLHGSRLRVQRTRRGKRFGGKNQDRNWSSFANLQVLEKKAEIYLNRIWMEINTWGGSTCWIWCKTWSKGEGRIWGEDLHKCHGKKE